MKENSFPGKQKTWRKGGRVRRKGCIFETQQEPASARLRGWRGAQGAVG